MKTIIKSDKVFNDDYIRQICEKVRKNIEMPSSQNPKYESYFSPKREVKYNESCFLQKMCNEINFFKEDSQQIGRTFGPYTFRGWTKNEGFIKKEIFSKPKDQDTYFNTQRSCLAIYNKTEKRLVKSPLLTPNIDNKDFFDTSLDLLCAYLTNTGVPKTGDVFGYFTVDFCGLHSSYREYCEKNFIGMSTRKPYHVDILYNDISYKQVNCIKMWRWKNTPIVYEPLTMVSKPPLFVYKGVNADKKEELLGNVYFNNETNKYETFDGYFWQEVDVNDEFDKLKTGQWLEINDVHNTNCDYTGNENISNYNSANTFNCGDNKEQQPTFIGNHVYLLKQESLDGSKQKESSYLLVKYIHDIFGVVLDCLVVKQLTGSAEKIFTLTKSDCAFLEIDYQSGLQVLPAQLNWECVDENSNKK